MKRTAIALFASLLLPTAANAIAIYDTVKTGEYLSIEFMFTQDLGDADVLLANGGGVSSGLLYSMVDLFVGDSLLASFANPQGNTYALFKDSRSAYAYGATADLSSIFAGQLARLEFHPVFDSSVNDAFIDYQLTSFGALESLSDGSLSDSIVEPALRSVGVLDEPRENECKRDHRRCAKVPEPASMALLAIGMLGIILARRSVAR